MTEVSGKGNPPNFKGLNKFYRHESGFTYKVKSNLISIPVEVKKNPKADSYKKSFPLLGILLY